MPYILGPRGRLKKVQNPIDSPHNTYYVMYVLDLPVLQKTEKNTMTIIKTDSRKFWEQYDRAFAKKAQHNIVAFATIRR